jgi:hypothetical protein
MNVSEIARNAADKNISPPDVKSEFRRNSRIGASENRRKRILSGSKYRPFRNEIVAPRYSFHIASIPLQQPVQGRIRPDHILRLRRRIDLRASRAAQNTEAQDGRTCEPEKLTPRQIRRTGRRILNTCAAHNNLSGIIGGCARSIKSNLK